MIMGEVITFPLQDALCRAMRRFGIKLTRENYVDAATNCGELDWTAEHDANLPWHELVDDPDYAWSDCR